ncbi:MAG TPA: fumarylacetoacetate hydrolase family protein [Mycobacteriales bacterium]|nr:fumarylacetoacetate hydrolase family protein [Mycobacteriales bacterium]
MRGPGLRLELEPALTATFAYGVSAAGGSARVCARVGDRILDLADAAKRRGFGQVDLLTAPTLDPLLAAGPDVWRATHAAVREWAADDDVRSLADVDLLLPFTVADYVDFYASEHHARNVSRILRPGQPELRENWRHQPIGYHGRAGTVVVSGTSVRRPRGPVPTEGGVQLRATARLDVEAEMGFVVGVPSALGSPVSVDEFADHVFGVVLLNDWSARDIQAWESVPLGPFLGKSFLTSVSPWVVPLDALDAVRIRSPSADTDLPAYLVETAPWGLDIDLELEVNGEVVSRPPYRAMHWSPAQLLAHLTVNGASLRTGDLVASGTVSGAAPDQVGSLLERWAGERFLADGDEVVIRAGGAVDLGEVRGTVAPAR